MGVLIPIRAFHPALTPHLDGVEVKPWSGTRGVLPRETPLGNSSGNWDSDPNYDLLVRVVTFWAHARWATPPGRWGTLTDFSFSSILWEQ